MKSFRLMKYLMVAGLVWLAAAPILWAEDGNDPTTSENPELPINPENPTEPTDSIQPENPTEPTDSIEPEKPDEPEVPVDTVKTDEKGMPCIILREKGGTVHYFPADSTLRLAVDGDSFTVTYTPEAETEDSVGCIEFYLEDVAGFKYGVMPPKTVTENVETEQAGEAAALLKDGKLTITSGRPGTVTVYNAVGQVVSSRKHDGNVSINLGGYAPGVYVIDSSTTGPFKFVVR